VYTVRKMKETHTVRRKMKTLEAQTVMRKTGSAYLLLIVPGTVEAL
jgi:hypothetical protein